MKFKHITFLSICFLSTLTLLAQKKKMNDGVDAEIAIVGKKSSSLIDETGGFSNRGIITYDIPIDLKDGLKIANANTANVNLELIMQAVNTIEKDNQVYKNKIDSGIDKNSLKGKGGAVDSFLLYKDDALILEEYFAYATQEKPHYQMSITKSIASYAVGIAIDQKKINNEDDYILKYFPNINPSKLSENTKQIKIKDVLSMQSGLQIKKRAIDEKKDNVTEQVLTKSNTLVPGTKYKYQGINPNMMVDILKKTTGYDMDDFVDKYLFGPMGITDYSFGESANGMTKAAAGMKLRSRDMLKIGVLCLNKGIYNKKRIISKNWVNKANGKYADNGKNKYGFFWWTHYITYSGVKYEINSCRGAGGQFIFSIPALNSIAVFTSYGSRKPFEILENVIIPSIIN